MDVDAGPKPVQTQNLNHSFYTIYKLNGLDVITHTLSSISTYIIRIDLSWSTLSKLCAGRTQGRTLYLAIGRTCWEPVHLTLVLGFANRPGYVNFDGTNFVTTCSPWPGPDVAICSSMQSVIWSALEVEKRLSFHGFLFFSTRRT